MTTIPIRRAGVASSLDDAIKIANDIQPRDLTPGEHAALAAAERIAELEALTSNLEEQNDRLRGERDTAQMRLKLANDRLAAQTPVQDVANALDRLNNLLGGELLTWSARLSACEQTARQIAAAGELR
jgi:uncharacterized protein YPO0396